MTDQFLQNQYQWNPSGGVDPAGRAAILSKMREMENRKRKAAENEAKRVWLNQNYPINTPSAYSAEAPQDCNYQPYIDRALARAQKEKELGLEPWGAAALTVHGQYEQQQSALCKQQREAERQAEEQKRKQAEREAWDRTPTGRVFNNYFRFAMVQMCHDVREGYLV
jgi:hypothetical protein